MCASVLYKFIYFAGITNVLLILLEINILVTFTEIFYIFKINKEHFFYSFFIYLFVFYKINIKKFLSTMLPFLTKISLQAQCNNVLLSLNMQQIPANKCILLRLGGNEITS